MSLIYTLCRLNYQMSMLFWRLIQITDYQKTQLFLGNVKKI